VDYVIVGVPGEWLAYAGALLDEQVLSERRRVLLTEGGANRNETLWKITQTATAKLSPPEDAVLVTHDAVRPFVTEEMISSGIEALAGAGKRCAVTTAVPCVDTILRVGAEGSVEEVPGRASMYQAQTPQTVYLAEWRGLYQRMTPEERELLTDVSGLYRKFGRRVVTVPGERGNLKITTPEDYEAALARIDRQKEDREDV